MQMCLLAPYLLQCSCYYDCCNCFCWYQCYDANVSFINMNACYDYVSDTYYFATVVLLLQIQVVVTKQQNQKVLYHCKLAFIAFRILAFWAATKLLSFPALITLHAEHFK